MLEESQILEPEIHFSKEFVRPEYKWAFCIEEQIVIFKENRPNIIRRFFQRLLFGWRWLEINGMQTRKEK